jgi:hypothetical protein
MAWPEFKKSTKEFKKYMVRTPKGKLVHFGGIKPDGKPYEQYKDNTGLGLYSRYDHKNEKRRRLYRLRHKEILTKEGKPAYLDREQPSFYSFRFLW